MNILHTIADIVIDKDDLDLPQVETADSSNVATILNIAFAIAGSIALIVIIIAGIQFMLSRGDPQKAAVARSAIIYAAVGLAIASSAFAIVQFVVESA